MSKTVVNIVQRLIEMFPKLDPDVVSNVLENCDNDENRAIELLVSFTEDIEESNEDPKGKAYLSSN